MIRLDQTATTIDMSALLAAQHFADDGALLFRDAVDPAVLTALVRASDQVEFVAEPVPQLGHRWIERPVRVGAAVETLINRPVLLDWLAAVSGRADVGRVQGRLVETRPGGNDGLSWHDDQIPDAQLGVTLHLRGQDYVGGSFELRRKGDADCRFRHDGARAGDLVLFTVDPGWEHRVQPISSGAARRVYTGWFMTSATDDTTTGN
jgi:hypothetical protein